MLINWKRNLNNYRLLSFHLGRSINTRTPGLLLSAHGPYVFLFARYGKMLKIEMNNLIKESCKNTLFFTVVLHENDPMKWRATVLYWTFKNCSRCLIHFFFTPCRSKTRGFFAGIFDPEQSRSNLVFFFLFAPGYLPCKNHFLVYWFQRMINCNIPDSSKNPNEICRLSVLMRIRAKSCEDTRMWDINFYDYSDGEKFIKGIA